MPALKYWDTATSTWKTGSVGLPSGQVWQQIIGDGLNTSFVVTHGFSTRAVSVSVYRNSPPYEEVQVDVERTDTNSVTVRTYPTVPAVSEYIVAVAAAGSQATLDITMDTWHTVGAAGEPAFTGGANESAGNPCQFRKGPDGKVQLRGRWTGGTGIYAIFQLPVGYRPQNMTGFTVLTYNNEGTAYVYVNNVGQVVKQSTTATFLDLAVIEFDTDTVLQTASVSAQPLDTVHYVGGVGEPAFVNSWVNYDNSAAVPGTAGQRSLRFRKFPDGRVRVSGVIKNGSAAAIFTLPAGYRPASMTDVNLPIGVQGGSGYVSVQSSGVVAVAGNTAGASPANYAYMEFEFDSETVAAYSTGTFPYLPITIDPWHTVGAAGEPAFNAGFAHSGSQLLQFRKLPDGQVKMRGYVSGPVGGGVIFTLPIGYRPPADYVRFPVESVTQTAGTPQTAQVFINAAGAVQAAISQTANPVNWDLSSVLFDTDTVLQTASVSAQPIDTWHTVDVVGGTTGEPKFQNLWVNYGLGDATAGFRKDPDGRVFLRGTIKTGSGVVFTLPVGYRPPNIVRDTVVAYSGSYGAAQAIIASDGTIQIVNPGSLWTSLNGIEFDTEAVSSYPSAFVQINAPARVTSLPTSPVDGQEVYYVADATNGVLWHLRYNAASASAYKWEFIGGGLLTRNQSADGGAVSTGTFVEPPNGPTITFPLAGDYYIEALSSVARTGAGAGNAQMRPAISSAALLLPADGRVQGSGFTAPNDLFTLFINGVGTTIAAASILRMFFLGGAMTVGFRQLAIRPARVG